MLTLEEKIEAATLRQEFYQKKAEHAQKAVRDLEARALTLSLDMAIGEMYIQNLKVQVNALRIITDHLS